MARDRISDRAHRIKTMARLTPQVCEQNKNAITRRKQREKEETHDGYLAHDGTVG